MAQLHSPQQYYSLRNQHIPYQNQRWDSYLHLSLHNLVHQNIQPGWRNCYGFS